MVLAPALVLLSLVNWSKPVSSSTRGFCKISGSHPSLGSFLKSVDVISMSALARVLGFFFKVPQVILICADLRTPLLDHCFPVLANYQDL